MYVFMGLHLCIRNVYNYRNICLYIYYTCKHTLCKCANIDEGLCVTCVKMRYKYHIYTFYMNAYADAYICTASQASFSASIYLHSCT